MQTSFADLVGAAVVPACCIDSTELADLTPALDTVAAIHDVVLQASEAVGPTITQPAPALDTVAADHDMAAQASEAAPTFYPGPCAAALAMAEQASEAAQSFGWPRPGGC